VPLIVQDYHDHHVNNHNDHYLDHYYDQHDYQHHHHYYNVGLQLLLLPVACVCGEVCKALDQQRSASLFSLQGIFCVPLILQDYHHHHVNNHNDDYHDHYYD
jgi:hypothetical protein